MDRTLGPDNQFGHPGAVAYECERCDCAFDSTVGAALAEHPVVVAFRHKHEVAVGAHRLWELEFAYDPKALAVVERGPARVELTMRYDDEYLCIEVDSDGTVIESRCGSLIG